MRRRAGTAGIVLMLIAVLASCEQAADHFEVWFANEPESDYEIIEFSLEQSPGTWEVSLFPPGEVLGKGEYFVFPLAAAKGQEVKYRVAVVEDASTVYLTDMPWGEGSLDLTVLRWSGSVRYAGITVSQQESTPIVTCQGGHDWPWDPGIYS